MKSKKNKINLGTKTRKFYDSFVSFLFNRFNKPKKIIQKGGATANDIKIEFLREVKQNILAQKRSGWNKCDKPDNIVREANKLLKTQKYTVLNNTTFIPAALTPELMSWFCGDVSSAPPTIGNLFLNSAGGELTDAELQTAFNLSAPDGASSSSAASTSSAESPLLVPPVPAATPLTEEKFYMDFRNEIKQIMSSKPCNDETIGEAGKQLMATDKYKNLAKQYEFNESYFLQHNDGKFLHWFCSDSPTLPENGFPTMFIPLRSNAKEILAAYNEAEDAAKPESEAKVGNGVLGTAGVVVGAVGALGTVGLGTAHYLTKGKPAQSTDTGVDSSATDSVSSNNTDLQNGNDVISPAPPVSSDGTEQQHASTDAESSDVLAPEPVESGNGTINGSPMNLPEQTEEQKNQEELEKEVAQEMEQERMEQERLEQKRQEQERMEQALKNPPNGWKKGFSITNGPFSYMTQDGSENWMRTKTKDGLPIWIKTTDKNRSSQETIPDEEFYNRFYPHEPSVKPTIEKQNKSETKPVLLPPPPPSPLVQLPGTNDSFSGQLGVAGFGNNTAPSYHPNSSSFGQGGPQIAPRGYTPTYTQVGVGVGLGTVTLGALAYYYLYGRKKVNRGASKTSSKKKSATTTPPTAPTTTAVAATSPPLETDEDRERREAAEAAVAATSPPLETDEDRERREAAEAAEAEAKQLETKKRQKMEILNEEIKKIIENLETYKDRCDTIVHHADILLNRNSTLYRKYHNKPKAFSKIINAVISFIQNNCGPYIDVSILTALLSEVPIKPKSSAVLEASGQIEPSLSSFSGNLSPREESLVAEVETIASALASSPRDTPENIAKIAELEAQLANAKRQLDEEKMRGQELSLQLQQEREKPGVALGMALGVTEQPVTSIVAADPRLDKYKRMLRFGNSKQAIRQKMAQDEMSEYDIRQVLGEEKEEAEKPFTLTDEQKEMVDGALSNQSGQGWTNEFTYNKMIRDGVPPEAFDKIEQLKHLKPAVAVRKQRTSPPAAAMKQGSVQKPYSRPGPEPAESASPLEKALWELHNLEYRKQTEPAAGLVHPLDREINAKVNAVKETLKAVTPDQISELQIKLQPMPVAAKSVVAASGIPLTEEQIQEINRQIQEYEEDIRANPGKPPFGNPNQAKLDKLKKQLKADEKLKSGVATIVAPVTVSNETTSLDILNKLKSNVDKEKSRTQSSSPVAFALKPVTAKPQTNSNNPPPSSAGFNTSMIDQLQARRGVIAGLERHDSDSSSDNEWDGGSRKRKRYTLKSKRKYKKRKASRKKR